MLNVSSTLLAPSKTIIAHPERYKCVQKDPSIVEEYIEKGCLHSFPNC